jgi:Tol biopolymer transport system component
MKTVIKILSMFIIVMVLVLSRTGIKANEPALTPPPINQSNQPATPVDEAKIKTLIQQLGNDTCQKRESAQDELAQYGQQLIEQYRVAKRCKATAAITTLKKLLEAFAQIIQTACQNNDFEIKIRAEQLRKHFYSTQFRIAFTSVINDIGGIYIMDADGANQQKIADEAWRPVWSPDGTKIAFYSDRDGKTEIYVMNADGQHQQKLTQNGIAPKRKGEEDVFYRWSPDGSKIAFTSARDGTNQLYIVDSDGRNQKKLSQKEGNAVLAWIHNGAKIVFASHPNEEAFEIHVIDSDGKNEQLLMLIHNYHDEIWRDDPVWSPDGTKIVCPSRRIEPECIYDGMIYIADADGKNEKLLSGKPIWASGLKWNPNGTKIVFQAEDDSKMQIHVLDINDKKEKVLTPKNRASFGPVWSPDGNKIVFTVVREDVTTTSGNHAYYDIYIIDSDEKNEQRLTQNQGNNEAPAWCPLSIPEIIALFAENPK